TQSMNIPAEPITNATECFYSADVQATGDPTGALDGTLTITSYTTTISFSVSLPVYTIEQVAPVPLPLTPGMTSQVAFTVASDMPGPFTGQTLTMTLPPGVTIPAGGVVRYICPALGTNIIVATNTTGTPTQSMNIPAEPITNATECFYSADVQATGDPTGILDGTLTITSYTTTISFSS
ncbi:hypothetical protein, partial [Streptomyces sp. NPDC001719]